MKLKERINRVLPYFKELHVEPDKDGIIIFMVVKLPNNWVIYDNLSELYNITVEQTDGTYFFVTELENGIDPLFDALEYNIEKMKEAMERAQLLKQKINELRACFEDENVSLDDLKNISVSASPSAKEDAPIFPKKGRPSNKQKIETSPKPVIEKDKDIVDEDCPMVSTVTNEEMTVYE